MTEKWSDNRGTYSEEFTFDTLGQLTSGQNKEEELAYPTERQYNQWGLLSQETFYGQGEYDAGRLLGDETYHYDLKNQTITIDLVGYSKLIKEYDSLQVLVMRDHIDINRDSYREYYKYDTLGNLDSTIHVDGNFEDTISISTFRYRFDKYNNWTRKKRNTEGDRQIVYRTISYY